MEERRGDIPRDPRVGGRRGDIPRDPRVGGRREEIHLEIHGVEE